MQSTDDSSPLTLACHPDTPTQAVQGIDVVLDRAPGDILTLGFALQGDISGLRVPEPRPPRRVDGLWRHTCCEVFLMEEGGPGYREFNFSPSGEWAVYAFKDYRDAGELAVESDPGIVVRRTGQRLELDAKISQELLPAGRALRLGLSMVVEDTDGVLSYWALRHPPGKPDFHHTDAFASQLVLY